MTDFNAIRKVHLHEKNHAQLSPLEEDFYSSCRQRISELDAQIANEFSIDAEKEKNNTARILREVVSLRQQKIVVKAQKDYNAGEVSSAGLTFEEKQLYLSIIKTLEQHENTILAGITAQTTMEQQQHATQNNAQPSTMALKIISDVMQFVGRDLKVHGPFKQNETIQLSPEDAQLLLKHGLAEAIPA